MDILRLGLHQKGFTFPKVEVMRTKEQEVTGYQDDKSRSEVILRNIADFCLQYSQPEERPDFDDLQEFMKGL